ncbi:MAG TPA: hypothetical protein VMV29_14680 [Ktedonobacterales bacterium]|nr:hypothetical protein [Ktedonobacterales bacterium]
MNWPAIAALGVGIVVIVLGMRGSYQNLIGWQGAFNPNYHGLLSGITPPTPTPTPSPPINPPGPAKK